MKQALSCSETLVPHRECKDRRPCKPQRESTAVLPCKKPEVEPAAGREEEEEEEERRRRRGGSPEKQADNSRPQLQFGKKEAAFLPATPAWFHQPGGMKVL